MSLYFYRKYRALIKGVIHIKTPNKYTKYIVFALLAIGITLFVVGYINSGENETAKVNDPTIEEQYAQRLEDMLSGVEGIGKMKIMVSCDNTGSSVKVNGVAIICQGGNDPEVVKDIIGIVGAVCGIASNRIYVANMEN